jgi:transcriptional regulator with XRE-family HTH domain
MSFPAPGGHRPPQTRFGILLRAYREARSLTQSQLADAAGYSMTLISRLESGQRNPTREVAEKTIAALGLRDDDAQQLLRTAGLSGEDADDVAHLTDSILAADPSDIIIRALVQGDISAQAQGWRTLIDASRAMREGATRDAVPVLRSLLARRDLALMTRIYAARKLGEAHRHAADLTLAEAALKRGEHLLDHFIENGRKAVPLALLGGASEHAAWPESFLQGSFAALRGEVEEQRGNYEAARKHYQRSRSRYNDLRNSLAAGSHRLAAQLGVCRSTIRLAKVANLLGENDEALVLCAFARHELDELPRSWQRDEADSLLKEAQALARSRKEDFDGAIKVHLQALNEAETGGNFAARMRNLLFLGDDYRRRVEARLDAARRSSPLGRLERSDGEILNGAPTSQGDLAEWIEAAARYYAAAEAAYGEREDPLILGQLLRGTAIVERYRGRYDEAEKLLLKALAQERDTGQNARIASVYTALGDVFWDRGMLQEARGWYRRARAELRTSEGGDGTALHSHLRRVDESLRAVERRATAEAGAPDIHADLARDWGVGQTRLTQLVSGAINAQRARPITDDETDPLWLKEMADFEALPGARVLAQNSLSISLGAKLPSNYMPAAEQYHELRRKRFLDAVDAAERHEQEGCRDLCTRHEVESRVREPAMRLRLLGARELMAESYGAYQLEAADFHALPLAFMVKASRCLIEIPAAFVARLELGEGAKPLTRTASGDQFCYRLDDATLADDLRDLFDHLFDLTRHDAVSGPLSESTEEWLKKLALEEASSSPPNL